MLNQSLFQINTRLLTAGPDGHSTLRNISDEFLDQVAENKFDFVYLLGVWQTGEKGKAIAQMHPDLQTEYSRVLPDFSPSDIPGSPFAVTRYSVHKDFGGEDALYELRMRLNERGIKLILDFVPNHVALDHPWIKEAPQRFVSGGEDDIARAPGNWFRSGDSAILAHGRDPYFAGWNDTAQLNYSSPDLRDAMKRELLKVSKMCDGVRCDMAMLLLPDVFRSTWHGHLQTEDVPCFWQETIPAVKAENPSFIFIAEVYWGLEWEMLQRGFDFAYDKTLYDRLIHGAGSSPLGHPYSPAISVRMHLSAPLDYQSRMVRFLENHDEPRIHGTVPIEVHKAAALVTFFSPGLRFIHRGQEVGKRHKLPVQLGRAPDEPVDDRVAQFYRTLLPIMNSTVAKEGKWEGLSALAAWEGNRSHEAFIACHLAHGSEQLVVAVNYSPYPAQCYLPIPHLEGRSHDVVLRDLLSREEYTRPLETVRHGGLFLDVPAWKGHLFSIQ
jgi:glycosidase